MIDDSRPQLTKPDHSDLERPPESDRELLFMVIALLTLLAAAAIVFLLVPTDWIGARVEVIFR